jgi:dolichol-phosphate mannosyltransferase
MAIAALDLSVCIPCHNEALNLPSLLAEIHAALAPLGLDYEIVATDDCSNDDTWQVMVQAARADSRLRVQRFERNAGESAASFAAIQTARGRIIATIDGDLQNDPADLPRLLAKLAEGFDCVCGSRVASRGRGDNVLKKLTSRGANRLRAVVLGDEVSDAGCTYRVFKREAIEGIPFFRGVHRFIPILMAFHGFTVAELQVNNRARRGGRSHYGLFDRAGAIVDMLGVLWLRKRMVRYRVVEHWPAER